MMNLLFALIVWFGQTAVPPVFEVASIKEARPPSSIENIDAGQFHIGMNINGSRADYGFMSLADLIPYSFRVKRYQLSGPGWMNETRWDILARIPEGQPAARAPEEEPGMGGGLNVRINNDGSGVAMSGGATGTMRITPNPNGGMQLQMAKITMAALADRLTQFMDRPVVDATGLKGNYQVTLGLPIEAMRGMTFAQKLAALAGSGSFGVPEANTPDTSGAPIIKSVRDLGLDLQSRKAPIETIIVDRVEKTPTAN